MPRGYFRRAMLRAFVVIMLVTGSAVGLTATPARACDYANLTVEVTGNLALRVGGTAQRVTVTTRTPCAESTPPYTVTMTVPLADKGLTISKPGKGCRIQDNAMLCDVANHSMEDEEGGNGEGPAEETFRAWLTPPDTGGPEPGRTWTGRAEVRVDFHGTDPGAATSSEFTVTLKPMKHVDEVSGVVTDEVTSEPVPNAVVRVLDGKDTEHTTATNNRGEFRLGSEESLIAPGNLRITVVKKGYDTFEEYRAAAAGQKITDVRIELRPEPAPATSTGSATADAAPSGNRSSIWPTLLLILGSLLLVLSVGGIAVLIRRRRSGGASGARYGDVGARHRPALELSGGPLGSPGDSPTLIDVYGGDTRRGSALPDQRADSTTVRLPGHVPDQPTAPLPPPHQRRGRHAHPED